LLEYENKQLPATLPHDCQASNLCRGLGLLGYLQSKSGISVYEVRTFNPFNPDLWQPSVPTRLLINKNLLNYTLAFSWFLSISASSVIIVW